MTGALHEDLCAFVITSHTILLSMRNVSGRSCRENQNEHFVKNDVFFSENRVVYETVWKSTVETYRSQMVTQQGEYSSHAA